MILVANVSAQYDVLDNSELATWSDSALISWADQQPARFSQVAEVLLARHRSWIVQRCRFRLNSEHDAQDVAQQVAIRAYHNLKQLHDPAGFKAWLGRIADNCCNSFAVQRARYVSNVDEVVCDETVAPSAIKHLEDREVVARVLTRLSAGACEVLSLRFFEDCSLEQIAQHLEIKLSAAKARLYRALEQFKAMYQQLLGE